MIKSYHRGLKGMIKIICKPRPIGNEIKNMSDAALNIVTFVELYKGKLDIQNKEFVNEFGATAATTLRLSENIQGSG